MSNYDAVIVGGRVAGATLATLLARTGRRVLIVDRDEFPSDTVSTHVMFPDTLQRLDEIGVMKRLAAAHDIPSLKFAWRVHGHEVAGGFPAFGAFDRATSVRRIVLDQAGLDVAIAAGAEARLGVAVRELVGSGTASDPVRGVVLSTGEHIEADLVFGADGRASTVARRLGLERTDERRGEMAFLMAYWRGLPPSEWCQIDVRERLALMSTPCEDGLHLLSVAGPPDFTRGSAAERASRYREALRQFPAVLNPRLLDQATQEGDLVVAPETMMRGYYRRAAGPGWALVGDAGHFKHPATAQGIGDAVAQAGYIAAALTDGRGLDGYDQWRADRAAEHYEWSFEMARFGSSRARVLYSGLAADREAGRQFLDTFTKQVRPSAVVTRERFARWEAAAAYEDGLRAVRELTEDLDEPALNTPVPACPAWTVRDLLGHLVGVAEDTVRGTYFMDALDAWRDESVAAAREEWTAAHVSARRHLDAAALLREFDTHGAELARRLRTGALPAGPGWLTGSAAADLSVHVYDLAEALGATPEHGASLTRYGFVAYREWLRRRLASAGAPALRLSDGAGSWDLGAGDPAATLTAPPLELFRAITGRRSAAEIRAYDWSGDPEAYLGLLSPYPLPA